MISQEARSRSSGRGQLEHIVPGRSAIKPNRWSLTKTPVKVKFSRLDGMGMG